MLEENEIILSVDDEEKNLRITQHIFEDDYQFVSASSGEDALEKIKEFVPAVILLDIMMPGIDGYEVCKIIKSDRRFDLTKIILISGKAMLEERLKGYEMGADDYVVKPFDPDELLAKIKIFIQLHTSQKELKKLNASLEEEVNLRTDQLIKSERIRYIGMHSAEIVHNLNNPITVIRGYTYQLLSKNPENNSYIQINKAVSSLMDIVKSVLGAVQKSEVVNPIDLNEVIRAEIEFIKINTAYRFKIKTELSLNSIPNFVGVHTHFSQIIGNLVKNSAEAMANTGGTLSLSTDQVEENIRIQISDTGSGINQDNIEQIFTPLFTTKNGTDGSEVIGTGLGLAYCKKMVEGYKGTISVKSAPEEGTTFIILLPLNEKKMTLKKHASVRSYADNTN